MSAVTAVLVVKWRSGVGSARPLRVLGSDLGNSSSCGAAIGGEIEMLVLGRQYRKGTAQIIAFAYFRWAAVWALVAYCASQHSPTQAAVIIAVDIIGRSGAISTTVHFREHERSLWSYVLTDRIFWQLLLNEARAVGLREIDVKEIFTQASKAAAADIAEADKPLAFEGMDSTWWHIVGGVLSFVGQFLSYGAYYGSAFYIGSGY